MRIDTEKTNYQAAFIELFDKYQEAVRCIGNSSGNNILQDIKHRDELDKIHDSYARQVKADKYLIQILSVVKFQNKFNDGDKLKKIMILIDEYRTIKEIDESRD